MLLINKFAPSRSFETAESGSDATRTGADYGLDWLNVFVANMQAGFGPFIAIYLASAGWSQTAIGVALSLGTLAAMASQIPAGALIDAVESKARAAAAAIFLFTLGALLFAVAPIPLFVYVAEILHSFSSCMLGPVIAAISLAIAGQRSLGIRLGRNARFASIGAAQGALLMGLFGYYLSERSIFYLVAGLTLPAFAALVPLAQIDRIRLLPDTRSEAAPKRGYLAKLCDRRMVVFATCLMLFTFANAAMLPLVSTRLNKDIGSSSNLFIASCIIVPQIIVALISPAVGRLAESQGRRIMLMIGLSAVPLRGVLFAVLNSPVLLTVIQALDGVTGACIGVLVPLIASDVAGRSGHYNLALGFLGFTIGVGATFSTTLAGLMPTVSAIRRVLSPSLRSAFARSSWRRSPCPRRDPSIGAKERPRAAFHNDVIAGSAGTSGARRGATSTMKRRIDRARCSAVPQSLPVTSSKVPKPPTAS